MASKKEGFKKGKMKARLSIPPWPFPWSLPANYEFGGQVKRESAFDSSHEQSTLRFTTQRRDGRVDLARPLRRFGHTDQRTPAVLIHPSIQSCLRLL